MQAPAVSFCEWQERYATDGVCRPYWGDPPQTYSLSVIGPGGCCEGCRGNVAMKSPCSRRGRDLSFG